MPSDENGLDDHGGMSLVDRDKDGLSYHLSLLIREFKSNCRSIEVKRGVLLLCLSVVTSLLAFCYS